MHRLHVGFYANTSTSKDCFQKCIKSISEILFCDCIKPKTMDAMALLNKIFIIIYSELDWIGKTKITFLMQNSFLVFFVISGFQEKKYNCGNLEILFMF